MWRRKIFVVVMALLIVATNISFSFPGIAVSGKATITIGMPGDIPGIAKAIEKAIPGVHVEVADLSYKGGRSPMQQFLDLDKEGKAPDILLLFGADLNEFIVHDALTDITQLLTRGRYIKSNDMAPIQAVLRVQPGTWRQGIGQQWGLVVLGVPCGFSLCINKALFHKAGIAIPSTKEPITYRKLLDYAKRLTIQKDGKTIQWGFGVEYNILMEMLLGQMLGTAGESLYSKDFLKVNIKSPEARDALRFFYDLERAGATPGALQSENQIVQRFVEGKCGIMVIPYTLKTEGVPKAISDQFLTLPAARLGDKWYDPAGGAMVSAGISKKTKNLKLTWQVFDWFCGVYSKDWAAQTGQFTGMKSTIPISFASLAKLDPQRLEVLKQSMYHSGLLQHNPYLMTAAIDSYCSNYLSQAVNNQISFDEMIDRIEKDVNNEIMKGRAAYLEQLKGK